MALSLMPHQQLAVEKLDNGKVLVGGVGTGKTRTALAYFYTKEVGGSLEEFGSYKTPMDIYVFTTARKRDEQDWQGTAIELGISTTRAWSVGGIQLTVDSYNNIGKYTSVHGAFIILDEQRMVGAGAWTKAFLHLAKSNRWIMLSATPGDVWEDYIPLFLANGFYKNRTQFKREHVVYNTFSRFPKVDHYIGTGKLVRLRNSILVEMPYERHTRRHLHTIHVDYDVESFEKVVRKRWHVYENRPLKDVSEYFSVMRKVVNSDFSRIRAVRGLMEIHPRLIVFYNFDYELEILRGLTTTWQSGQESRTPNGLLVPSSPRSSNSTESPLVLMDLPSGATSKPLSRLKGNRPLLGEDLVSTLDDPTKLSDSQRLGSSTPSATSSRLNLNGTSTNEQSSWNPSSLRSSTHSGDFSIAEWNGHKHQPVPTTDSWVYLVQYVAGAEAWNCVTTDTVVFYSLTYSYKNFHQAQGRIDRLDTPFVDLHYYVLQSDAAIDKAIGKSLREKRDFNEKSFRLYT